MEHNNNKTKEENRIMINKPRTDYNSFRNNKVKNNNNNKEITEYFNNLLKHGTNKNW